MHSQFIPQREVSTNQYTRKLSPISKYTSDSAPYSRVKSVTAMRKKPWNRRFIYNKIPDYYQIRDKNIFLNKKPRVNSMHKNNIFDTNYLTYQQSRINYNRKKNIVKGFNRTTSGFFSQNSYMTNNNEFTLNNRNMASPLTNSALNRNNLYKENLNLNLNVNSNDENFNSIKKMWNELCVYMSYREVFIIIYNQLTGEEKEQFYQKELNELNTVKNDIKSLNYYIEQRTLILKDLYEQNIKLNRKKNSDDVINELLADMSDLIEKLREATIDVCYAMRKLKNDMNIVNNIAKYNIDLLSSKSKFDKNYLIKMKGELSFLKEGNAKFFFNVSEDRSPFLLKASDPILNNEKDIFMRIVPLKDEIKEHIKECNYYIYQELIAYQQNILARKKMFRCVSPIKSNTRNFISNSSFINMNKEGDLSQNINFGLGLNESNGFRKVNKNIFNDFPSDINSVLSTHNFFDKKLGLGGWPNLNRQMPKPNKDLFSQKLLSGFIPGDWEQEIFAEDEKVKDEKEEEKENEEEEEEEEKSEDDTTRNELNELIEEKKSETEGNENTNSKANSKINLDENKKIDEDNKEQDINKNIDKNISKDNIENNNKEVEDNKNINNNKNEDINKYLNNNIDKKSNSSKSKNNSIKEENKDDKAMLNNPINLNNFSEKEEDKKSNNNKNISDINNKKEENNIDNNKINNNENNKEENKEDNKNE
jgi:hypothetical protein